MHGRVVRWEANGGRILRDVGDPDGPRLGDEQAQDSSAHGEFADVLALLGGDADCDELEDFALRAKHSERRVLRTGELGGQLRDPLQDVGKR